MGDSFIVKINKDSYERWRRYVASHLQYRVNGVLGEEGDAAAKWIADTYLHGKAMKEVTGGTIAHFGVRWSKRYKSYLLAPGYKVPGNQNYLARYVGTRHEFIKPGFNEYFRMNDISRKLEDAIGKALEERK